MVEGREPQAPVLGHAGDGQERLVLEALEPAAVAREGARVLGELDGRLDDVLGIVQVKDVLSVPPELRPVVTLAPSIPRSANGAKMSRSNAFPDLRVSCSARPGFRLSP